MSEAAVFLISVEGDVGDAEQAELRAAGLFPAGHIGLSASKNTRTGSCTTFFNVLSATEADAEATANVLLARFGRTVAAVDQVA
jgi:hypothetical protein